MTDPTKLTPDDLRATAARELPSDADADPDEAVELERQRAHRWGRVVSIADAYRARHAERDPLRRATEASLARIRYWQRRDRAPELGVPGEDGVLDHAAQASPTPTVALDAVRAALAWRARRGPHRALVLALCGGVGTGKSVALAWAVLHHDRGARMLPSDRAGSYDPSQAHTQSRAEWDRLVAVDLLAIDELGDEERADRVGVLLRARYNAGRATLLAGNVTPLVFRDRYCDERLRSRLARQRAEGQRVTVALRGPDLRTTPRGDAP